MKEGEVSVTWLAVILPVCFGLGVAATATNSGHKFINKMILFMNGSAVFLLSRDFSWKKQADPAEVTNVKRTVKVIFIRHGESVWNEVFNKGLNLGFLVRLGRALVNEALLLASSDSVFYDSPLSAEGIAQAKSLLQFLEGPTKSEGQEGVGLGLVRGAGSSVLVVSSMRRAMQTVALGLWGRLQRDGQKVYVLTSLQEISRNVDCYPLAGAHSLPPLHSQQILSLPEKELAAKFDISEYEGAKSLSSNGLKRMQSFAHWAAQRKEDCVIIGGHSLWFRAFFQTFLPHSSTHVAKSRKLHNCGMVMFDLEVGERDGQEAYRIAPDSLVSLYRGFM